MTRLLALILSFSLASLAFIFLYQSLIKNESKVESKKAVPVLVSSGESGIYDENGCPVKDNQNWLIGRAIGCKISTDGKLLGKFIFNGLYSPERYYELFIQELYGDKNEHRIYAGDFRTLGWEWVGSGQVEITYNCGTGCQALKKIKIDESISSSDYLNGQMNEQNGWEIKFAKSF